MKNRKFYGDMGSVSCATMREEDLIPAFVYAAKQLRLTRSERTRVCEIERMSKMDGYYDTEDCSYDLNESLFDILNNHALPYFYFGSHPGDGADYGFWLSEEWQEGFDGLKVSDLAEVPKNHSGEVAVVNDHGNVTLYAYTRGRRREVWSIV